MKKTLQRWFLTLDKGLQRRLPHFHQQLPHYWQLTRMNRPIGIGLLLWPTLWCLWISAQGIPDLKLIFIFVMGTVCMRAAGCCINDYADRNFDGHVLRTSQRPIVTGKVSPKEALYVCAFLCLVALLLVLLTNQITIFMAFGGLLLAFVYPFMKRHTHLAQIALGAAFSWGGMMAFTAQTNSLPVYAGLLYMANVIWTVVYDTQYAMVDRDDDIKLGLKSTAILFAEADRVVIGIMQFAFLLTMSLSAKHFDLGIWFQTGLLLAGCLFIYQLLLIRKQEPKKCFKAFLNNNYVGMIIFIFTVIDLLPAFNN